MTDTEEKSLETIPEDNQLAVSESLAEMCKITVTSLDKLKEEHKMSREMITDALNNDAEYKQRDDAVKAATKERLRIKKEILGQQGMLEIINKEKDQREEIKEKQVSLEEYAGELSRMTGITQLELFENDVLEFVQVTKVRRVRKH